MLAPIVLFVYNRPYHTQQTVESLLKNDLASESDLYIFADGPKERGSSSQIDKIQQVRNYIEGITGFKSITIEKSVRNKGLANSVISGVSKVIDRYGRAIVVEDDIVSNRFFLRFMNEALEFYKDDTRLYCVGGFNYNFPMPQDYADKNDTYIVHRSETWGWGTWKRCWDNVDWAISDYNDFVKQKRKVSKFCRGGEDMAPMLQSQMEGEIDSWAIRWDYHLYKHDAYCLRPCRSLTNNIGFDGTGVHCGTMDGASYTAAPYSWDYYNIKFDQGIKQDKRIAKSFKFFQDHIVEVPVHKKLKRAIKRFVRNLG